MLLTPAGARLAERIAPAAAAVRGSLVRGMTRREQEALRASLRKVIENVRLFTREMAGGHHVHDGGAP